jgi:hypothetical protein
LTGGGAPFQGQVLKFSVLRGSTIWKGLPSDLFRDSTLFNFIDDFLLTPTAERARVASIRNFRFSGFFISLIL